MEEHVEGGARFFADTRSVVSADMGVFYNPQMRENRDLSLFVISWLLSCRTPRRLIFPMAASGVRPWRMFEELEVPPCEVVINDLDPRAIEAAKSSRALNPRASAWGGSLIFSNTSAQALLASGKPADYIEIDPFGSPLPFLDAAIQRIAHRGVLAVTATDTAALCGTYPKTGLRKYHAFTARSPLMHEHAARILAHVVERNASRHGRYARVIFAYAHLHYVKLFFEVYDSKSASARIIADAEYWRIDRTGFTRERVAHAHLPVSTSHERGQDADLRFIGPLSAQPLADASLIEHIDHTSVQLSPTTRAAIGTIREESRIAGSAIDLHVLASEMGLASVPRTAHVIERLGAHRASRTRFSDTAIRTGASLDEIREAMR
jgi:tRNA (guanine26-N2/guanine27-N2)-dimethyltransferase